MRKNDKALFIAVMAFILALFAYFRSNTVEGLVPGFEKAMQSNWKVQNVSEGAVSYTHLTLPTKA